MKFHKFANNKHQNQMIITKEIFCSSIDALRKQNHQDRTFTSLMNEAFGAEIGILYNNQILIDWVIDFLATEFDREEIVNYCYCLNFGKLSSEEDFETEEQLYERLIKTK